MRIRIAFFLMLLTFSIVTSAETVDFDKFVVQVDDSRRFTLTDVDGDLPANESYAMGLALPFREGGSVFELRVHKIETKDNQMEITFEVKSEVQEPFFTKSLIFLTPISAPIAIPDWDQVEQGVTDHKPAYGLLGWSENFTRDTPSVGEHSYGLKVRSGTGTSSDPYIYFDTFAVYDNTTGWVNSYNVHMTKVVDNSVTESALLSFEYTPDAVFTPLTATDDQSEAVESPLPLAILPLFAAIPVGAIIRKRK